MSISNHSPSLFKSRLAYKPFDFPWAYTAFVDSESMHWLATEVPLNDDVKDWNTKLNTSEINLLTQIFRFFTQADIDVAGAYIDRYLPLFKPVEVRMAMTSIAAREAVHIQAYSMLIDEIGIPETEYSAFLDYAEMKDKHEYLYQERDGDEGMARDIAVFSAFGEGLQLFASFVMLLNFTRFGKMKGMGQIVAWSIRDESHHVEFMMKVFQQFLDEKPHVWTDAFKKTIYDTARDMVALEDRFIDLVFGNGEFEGGIEGLTADDVKQYIRFIADRRLIQLGLKPNYGISKNPLPWVDVIVNGKEHVNFFENRATDYSKGAVTGSWDDAFSETSGEDSFDFGDAFDLPAPAGSITDLVPPKRPSIDVGGGIRVPVSMGFPSGSPNPNTPALETPAAEPEVASADFLEIERLGLSREDLEHVVKDAVAGLDEDHWVVVTKVEWEKCPYCVKAKNLLLSKGIAYEQKALDPETMPAEELAEFRQKYRTVPQIWHNGKHVGGYEQLVAYLNS